MRTILLIAIAAFLAATNLSAHAQADRIDKKPNLTPFAGPWCWSDAKAGGLRNKLGDYCDIGLSFKRDGSYDHRHDGGECRIRKAQTGVVNLLADRTLARGIAWGQTGTPPTAPPSYPYVFLKADYVCGRDSIGHGGSTYSNQRESITWAIGRPDIFLNGEPNTKREEVLIYLTYNSKYCWTDGKWRCDDD